MFDPTSRYHLIATARHRATDGTEHEYKLRRFLPLAPPATPPHEVVLLAHDRLDLIAARLAGNPVMFWRICDVNAALDPFELVGPERAGNTLLVPTSAF